MSVNSQCYQNPLTPYIEGYSNYGSFNEQTDQVGKIISHNDRIRKVATQYKQEKKQIKNAKNKDGSIRYKDFDHYNEDGSIWLDYLDKKSTTKDAAKEDINKMILEQNNAYIVGIITISTILATIFIVMKK